MSGESLRRREPYAATTSPNPRSLSYGLQCSSTRTEGAGPSRIGAFQPSHTTFYPGDTRVRPYGDPCPEHPYHPYEECPYYCMGRDLIASRSQQTRDTFQSVNSEDPSLDHWRSSSLSTTDSSGAPIELASFSPPEHPGIAEWYLARSTVAAPIAYSNYAYTQQVTDRDRDCDRVTSSSRRNRGSDYHEQWQYQSYPETVQQCSLCFGEYGGRSSLSAPKQSRQPPRENPRHSCGTKEKLPTMKPMKNQERSKSERTTHEARDNPQRVLNDTRPQEGTQPLRYPAKAKPSTTEKPHSTKPSTSDIPRKDSRRKAKKRHVAYESDLEDGDERSTSREPLPRARLPSPSSSPITFSQAAIATSPTRERNWRVRPCYALIFLGLLTVSGSLAAALWRSVDRNDISGGFSLAQYILGVGVFIIGSMVAIHSRYCTCWQVRNCFSVLGELFDSLLRLVSR